MELIRIVQCRYTDRIHIDPDMTVPAEVCALAGALFGSGFGAQLLVVFVYRVAGRRR